MWWLEYQCHCSDRNVVSIILERVVMLTVDLYEATAAASRKCRSQTTASAEKHRWRTIAL